MARFIMLTEFSPGAAESPCSVVELGQKVRDKIAKELPQVQMLESYVVLGPFDFVDVFEAPDTDTANDVAMIANSFGHVITQVLPATEWERYRQCAGEGQAGAKAEPRRKRSARLEDSRFPVHDPTSWSGATAASSRRHR